LLLLQVAVQVGLVPSQAKRPPVPHMAPMPRTWQVPPRQTLVASMQPPAQAMLQQTLPPAVPFR
jgi:hypothetical protein